MATLNIRDETYRQLAAKAALANTTVEALVEPELLKIAQQAGPLDPAAGSESRRQAFALWQRTVAERADRYPPGHVLDDGRESIYFGDEDRGR